LSAEKVRQVRTLAVVKANRVPDICKTLGISRATFYQCVAAAADTELGIYC
jgi:predicted DNA-binding transcriptional regulator AlpA